jgi:hypothetical protein
MASHPEDSNCHSQYHANIRSHGTGSGLSPASEVTGCTVNYHDSVTGRVTGNFSLHHYIQNHVRTDSGSIQWIRVPFLSVKLLKEWSRHSPPSSRKDENGRSFTTCLYCMELTDWYNIRLLTTDSGCLNFCKFLKSRAAEQGMWPILRCLRMKELKETVKSQWSNVIPDLFMLEMCSLQLLGL